jgi:hypothetical protein
MEMKKIRIVRVDDNEMVQLKILRKVVRSRAGAYRVTLVPQNVSGVDIPKMEVWFPKGYIDKEFSTQPDIVTYGRYLNPILKSIQIQALRDKVV